MSLTPRIPLQPRDQWTDEVRDLFTIGTLAMMSWIFNSTGLQHEAM